MTLIKTETIKSKHGSGDMVAMEIPPGPRWATWGRFPLMPQLRIRTANEQNTSSFHFHWLAFRFWTLDSIGIEVDARLEEDLGVYLQLPYCKMGLSIPLLPLYTLQRFWRRPSGLKRYY
jgi:hypothetical protein